MLEGRTATPLVQLVPIDAAMGVYCGFATVQGREYRIKVHIGPPATLELEPSLLEIMRPVLDAVSQRLKQAANWNELAVELNDVLARLSTSIQPAPLLRVRFYDETLIQIDELGWDKLASADSQLQRLRLVARDSQQREHFMDVELPSEYPRGTTPPVCTAQLPSDFHPLWTVDSRLVTLHSQFSAALAAFEKVWDELDDLDAATCVLEPANPARDCLTRRIAIGQHCSLQLTIFANKPRGICEVRMLGSEAIVKPLRERFANYLGQWSEALPVRANLEAALGFVLPSRTAAAPEDYSAECGICYSYRLEGTVPEHMCDNARCAQPYHYSCLLEWLRGLPSSRQSYHILFGECPYCAEPLTLRVQARAD